ncbi:MAG TPA: DUF393 domain-containing protein, partial [Streptomyces sp.]|nr:DUF393 domain-containing protein [Streptomyces sp.]
ARGAVLAAAKWRETQKAYRTRAWGGRAYYSADGWTYHPRSGWTYTDPSCDSGTCATG